MVICPNLDAAGMQILGLWGILKLYFLKKVS